MKKEIKQISTSRVWLIAIAFFLFAMPSAPIVKSQAENKEPSQHESVQPPGQEEQTVESIHRSADLVGISVEELEASIDPTQRVRNSRAAVNAQPHETGQWSSIIETPVVPVFASLLPNGTVLLWASVGENATETYEDHTFTRTVVWYPNSDTSQIVGLDGYNIFCAGFILLDDGRLFVAGGNKNIDLDGLRETHIFDYKDNSWSRGADMRYERWYPSLATTPNNEVFIMGGGPNVSEVRQTDGNIRELSHIPMDHNKEYPFIKTTVNGDILYTGPESTVRLINPMGTGSLREFGDALGEAVLRTYASYAMYDIGKTLVAGGVLPARNEAYIVDSTSGTPSTTRTNSMIYPRRQHNLTILPDGRVLATGGINSNNLYIDTPMSIYASEVWDPATEEWEVWESMQVSRQYHSTALLLPDGRLMIGGGGVCEDCQEANYLERNIEYFSPPYLFDSTGQPASRPIIRSVQTEVTYNSEFVIDTPNASSISKVALVGLGASTHGQNMGQRYVPLQFVEEANSIKATSPVNANVAPSGYYMLFILDNNGVPSVAEFVRIKHDSGSIPPPSPPSSMGRNVALNKSATASSICNDAGSASNAVNGSVDEGDNDKWCANVNNNGQDQGPYWLTVDLEQEYVISQFVVRHAGAGGEDVANNTSDFQIQWSADGTSDWTALVNVSGNTDSVTTHPLETPTTARYIRLYITGANSIDEDFAAHIYEFEVYGIPASSPSLPPPPSDEGGNVALNKYATASHICNDAEAASKAINGSVSGGNSDKWCANANNKDQSQGPYWLTVDLRQNYAISQFVVKHAGAGDENIDYNTRDFQIQWSVDGASDWAPLVDVAGNTDNVTTHPLGTPVTARYIRLYITAAQSVDQDVAARIYEFEVYGTPSSTPSSPPPSSLPPSSLPPSASGGVSNVALNKSATASSICNAVESGTQAVNGSVGGGYSDKWCANDKGQGPYWLTVDLGQDYAISQFMVRHAGAAGENVIYNTRDFQIQWSADGISDWTPLVDVVGNSDSISTHSLGTPATARYIRLYITAAKSINQDAAERGIADPEAAARIYEFEVYGTPSSSMLSSPSSSLSSLSDRDSNVALNKSATAISICNGAEAASKVFDWSVSGGYSDKLCANDRGQVSLLAQCRSRTELCHLSIRGKIRWCR